MSDADEVLLEEYEQEEDLADQELDEEERPRAPEQPIVTADDAMTLQEARLLSGRRGARLVLLMGEPRTGKNTLTATLWQRFLEADGLAGHRLAGSRTARGFERRAQWARQEARQPEAHFPVTRIEDGGLLHLRVRRGDGARVELLLSDLGGEQFERVREGRPLLEELPWAARVDRFAVVVDATALAVPGASEIAVTRARRQLLALRTPTLVRDTARLAVVITKSAALNRAGEDALARHEPVLLALARELDPEALTIRTAALGPDGADLQGLGDLLSWLCSDDRPQAPIEMPDFELGGARSIAAFRA